MNDCPEPMRSPHVVSGVLHISLRFPVEVSRGRGADLQEAVQGVEAQDGGEGRVGTHIAPVLQEEGRRAAERSNACEARESQQTPAAWSEHSGDGHTRHGKQTG